MGVFLRGRGVPDPAASRGWWDHVRHTRPLLSPSSLSWWVSLSPPWGLLTPKLAQCWKPGTIRLIQSGKLACWGPSGCSALNGGLQCLHVDVGLTICFPSGRVTRTKDLRVGLLKALDIGLIHFPLKSRELYRWFRRKQSATDAERFPSAVLSSWRRGKKGLSFPVLFGAVCSHPGGHHFSLPLLESLLSSTFSPPASFCLQHRGQAWVQTDEVAKPGRHQLVLMVALTWILCLTFLTHFLIRSFSKSHGRLLLILCKNS